MRASAFETILLREDVTAGVEMRCLACKQRVGEVAYAERRAVDRPAQVVLSHEHQLVHEYCDGAERVVLSCRCGHRSVYHVL
ncbi:MAG: hypothetical protein AAF628_17140 [Planctomycetota bacterium]